MGDLDHALRADGRVALMCAAWQRQVLAAEARRLGLVPILDASVDRKGTECAVLVWELPQAPERSPVACR